MILNKKHVLFDLDGTLTDPYLGISNCILYALEKLGHKDRPNDLRQYIGPALRYAFSDILKTDDSDALAEAVRLYRERYATLGIFENTMYPNIEEVLKELKQSSAEIYLATAKPEPYARQILDHFNLSQYFTEVSGATLDGSVIDKTDIIENLIKRTALDPLRAVMIGDRHYDVDAGKAHSMKTVGVTYGFGSIEELSSAGADLIVSSPLELLDKIQIV